jgi:hypothetical protein
MLIDLGIEQLTTIDSAQRVVPSHRFEATTGDGGPSKADLRAAVEQWLQQHPNHNRTVVEQLMDDAGHSLVYTPPFCPEVQPIELLWAEVKSYVAQRSTHNRSITEAREQTEEAFEKVSKMFFNNIIKHCHDWIDSFLTTDAAEDLAQCGSLAGVIKHLSLLKLASSPTNITPFAPSSAPAASAASAAASSASSSPAPSRSLRRRH